VIAGAIEPSRARSERSVVEQEPVASDNDGVKRVGVVYRDVVVDMGVRDSATMTDDHLAP
jgi:hypothetical protein